MHEALFWEPAPDKKVRCALCRFRCLISDGKRGRCGVRENSAGVLYTLVYGRTISENVDPIEKKPLFHYYPGSKSFSIATVGCNFRCLHCQNWQISQWRETRSEIPGHPLSPDEIVRLAQNTGCRSIAYTYTEPTIFYEYAFDTALRAKEAGIGNVFVTNGYTTTEALEKIAPYLDAANIDLKGFNEDFYRDVTGGTLHGVLDTLRDYRRLGIWIEVTTLIIPGHNDDDKQLRGIARFIAEELGPHVPWHVTAFFPTYRMTDIPPTSAEALHRARQIGFDAGLNYVYEGNLYTKGGENTLCPVCREKVIEREGFNLVRREITQGCCNACGAKVEGIGLG